MVTTPGLIAVITPDDDPTDAISTLLLDHMPPGGVAGNTIELPTQSVTNVETPITGTGFTVIVVVAKQPVDSI